MGAKVHEERLVAVPADQDAQIVVDAEGPIGVKLTFQFARPKERVLWAGREAAPLATFRDLKVFVEHDGWTEEPNLVRGRARTGDHWRYRKDLPDGTSLRTKVSHSLRDEIGIDLFKHILRDQLRVTEDRFWDVVRGGPTEVTEAFPPQAATIPGRLVQRLILTVGLREDEIRAMTVDEAHAACEAYKTPAPVTARRHFRRDEGTGVSFAASSGREP